LSFNGLHLVACFYCLGVDVSTNKEHLVTMKQGKPTNGANTMKVELNISDIAILTDILIEQSKRCETTTAAEWILELIEKIQAPLKGE
jgi:hypothetical protein